MVRGTRGIPIFGLALAFAAACGGAGTPATDSPAARTSDPTIVNRPRDTASPTEAPVTQAPIEPTGERPEGETTRARVVEVIDGDTIVVRLDGAEYEVRYIGIDAPERGDGPNSRQATRANSRLVGDKRVWLEKDVSETDDFDRLLRHVWLKDGKTWTLVNAELVRRGLAEAASYPPDTLYDSVYFDAEAAAQDAGVGLWTLIDEQTPGPEPEPEPEAQLPDPVDEPQPDGPGSGGNCDPSYPEVCIPPAPPDLNCDDVPYDDIVVIGRDPHGFDGNDNDGWGCES